MYLKRKIDSYLIEWKSKSTRKPLIIKGARQVGKTASIREFAKNNYDNFIEINFIEKPEYKTIASNGYTPDKIIKNISIIDASNKFIEGKTLIFFDEFQTYPEIATSLKFFAIDGRYDVICSGSLLGINYKSIESVSVGYQEVYEMQSLDFQEFLWAKGYSDEICDEMLKKMIELTPFSSTEMLVFNQLFIDYCILGGMPEIIANYIINNNFSDTLYLQQMIVQAYKDDIRKYAEGLEQTKIIGVFEHITTQLAKENKKFQYSSIKSGGRAKDYWGCIEWLRDAGIINICYSMAFPELPLKGNYNPDKFKLYFKDTGLLVATLDEEARDNLRINKALGIYKGGLFENIVGEAISKSGGELYYYKREDGTLAEDFFLRTMTNLVPIEVKAKNSKSKSMTSLIKNDKYSDITWGIKLCSANIGKSDDLYTFPYFCAFLLKKYLKSR